MDELPHHEMGMYEQAQADERQWRQEFAQLQAELDEARARVTVMEEWKRTANEAASHNARAYNSLLVKVERCKKALNDTVPLLIAISVIIDQMALGHTPSTFNPKRMSDDVNVGLERIRDALKELT
jgi:hypothetical protein